MKFSGNINALVCSSLSQNAILGMDAIKQMKLALNPISQQFFHVNNVEVNQCGKLSGNVKLQPFEVRTVKIQTDMPDGNVLISPTTELMEIWNIFIPDAVIKVREGKGHLVIKNCLPTESVMSRGMDICVMENITQEVFIIRSQLIGCPIQLDLLNCTGFSYHCSSSSQS